MPSRPPAARRLWLIGRLIWTVLGFLSAAQGVTWRIYAGRPADWGNLVPTSLADWLTCGMFAPAPC